MRQCSTLTHPQYMPEVGGSLDGTGRLASSVYQCANPFSVCVTPNDPSTFFFNDLDLAFDVQNFLADECGNFTSK